METSNQNKNLYPKGSIWRKWDLHVHSPKTYRGFYDNFVKNINESEAEVIGINDYSTIEGYENVVSDKNLKKIIFPVIEFRMNNVLLDKDDPRLKRGKKFNFHIIFDNDIGLISRIKNWLNSLECFYEGGKKEQVGNIQTLDNKISFDYFNVIQSLETKEGLKNRYLVWLPYDEYGGIDDIDPNIDKYFKLGLIDKAHIIGTANRKQINFFAWKSEKHSEEKVKKWLNGRKISCIKGSDAHKIDYPFGKLCDGNSVPINKYCWIKADPTFEGLKQILYEPESGDRIWIGEVMPDQKNNYQVIKKIKFSNTSDFLKEIIFNQNLCSIIGSRSSGKSALLNYIAHAIDSSLVESLTSGPGEGEEYKWEKIGKSRINYVVEWTNGPTSDKGLGKIVFIPQNYLINKSRDSDEVKKRIEPVLFKKIPDLKVKYEESVNRISACNKEITNLVNSWFKLSNSIEVLRQQIKDLGDRDAIENEKKKINKIINNYKQKYNLKEEDIKKYQEINNQIAELEDSIKYIQEDIDTIDSILGTQGIFQELRWQLEPEVDNLPQGLADKISKELERNKGSILESVNKIVKEFKDALLKKIKTSRQNLQKITTDNKDLLEKYKKNEELEKLSKKVAEHEQNLKQIDTYRKDLESKETTRDDKGKEIRRIIQKRKNILKDLKKKLDSIKQSNEDIKFSIEYGTKEEDLGKIGQKVNLKEATDFVKEYRLNIESVREKTEKLLSDTYSGAQKTNKGYDKREVVIELLTLTEAILFVGKMEGDRIGGFFETTMTPGRRALFLLKLILAESDDKWPILIDQPEENLDSRSITDEIVPFLKKKKKERQVIMVSHNANLAIGADSEQMIVANRHGSDRPNEDKKQFNYLSGSIENTKEKDTSIEDTLKCQGIREHACLILDGGKEAFEHRRNKYNLIKL